MKFAHFCEELLDRSDGAHLFFCDELLEKNEDFEFVELLFCENDLKRGDFVEVFCDMLLKSDDDFDEWLHGSSFDSFHFLSMQCSIILAHSLTHSLISI